MRYCVAVFVVLLGCSADVVEDQDMSFDMALDLVDMPADAASADLGADVFVPPPDPCQTWVFGAGAPPFEDGYIFEDAVEVVTQRIASFYTGSGPGAGWRRVAPVDTLIMPAHPADVFDWVVYTEGDQPLKFVVASAPNKYGPFWFSLFVERGFEPVPFKVTQLYPDTATLQDPAPAIWRQANNDYMVFLLELPAPDSPGLEPVVIDSQIDFESGGGDRFTHSFAHYHDITEPSDYKVCAKNLRFRDSQYPKGGDGIRVLDLERQQGVWREGQRPWRIKRGAPMALRIDTGYGTFADADSDKIPRMMSYSLYDIGRSRLHHWKVRWGEAAREPTEKDVFRHREYVTVSFEELGLHKLYIIGYEDPFGVDRTFLRPHQEQSWIIDVKVVE